MRPAEIFIEPTDWLEKRISGTIHLGGPFDPDLLPIILSIFHCNQIGERETRIGRGETFFDGCLKSVVL